MVSNAGHPHDPHPENSFHPQPLMAARPAYHAWHCHRNNYFLHLAWQTARYTSPAACVLPVVSRHDLRVYAAGDADEDLRVEVWRAAVGVDTNGTNRRRHRTEAQEKNTKEVFTFFKLWYKILCICMGT